MQAMIFTISIAWLPLASIAFSSEPQAAAAKLLSPAETAARIDQLFEASWKANEVIPAPRADDYEFLRRVYLDLAGRIPAVSETRQFLEDSDPDKRRKRVEQLLDSPAYVRNITTALRNALIPQADSQLQFRGLIPGFEAWLWKHVSEESPWDQVVREIITTPVGSQSPVEGVIVSPTSPDAFFAVRELKPENLATGTARAFLGVRLDCAQCHDHPFDKWKQQQFWNLAAFYSGFQRAPGDEDSPVAMAARIEMTDSHEILIPSTGEVVPAVFLTGLEPKWTTQQTPRTVLAEWITDRQNPWFARMAANRMWAQFFGLGIVHPIDDFSDNNPPTHPEVLDLLASQFVAHDYDLKFLVRTLTATNVYHATSRQTDASQGDSSQFARAALRGLTPEQFFDSLAEAVGFYQPYRSDNPFVVNADTPRGQFLTLFRDEADSPLQKETTILQALAMMNSDFVGTATSLENSQTLRAVTEFPLMTDEERLETLFLAVLSRPPTPSERAEFGEYIAASRDTVGEPTAMADVFWALLNSSEFLLNH
jgi:Protein of unknown function (DUF1549)/Protein of unknown function (DUF1553)